jgi:hypothetical protein
VVLTTYQAGLAPLAGAGAYVAVWCAVVLSCLDGDIYWGQDLGSALAGIAPRRFSPPGCGV